MSNFVSDAAFWTKVGRAFQHGAMRKVCEKYNPPARQNGVYIAQEGQGFPSQVIAPDLRMIAETFITLHEARETADYDDAQTVQHTGALAAVQQVERAFQAWLTVQTHSSAVTFLQELLCRSIIKNR
jgi:hypothetical protein